MMDKIENIRKQGMAYYGFGPDAMKKIKVCTVCGQPVPIDRRFCHKCRNQVSDKTLYDMYKENHKRCPVCDVVLYDRMDYCPQCGTKTQFNTKKNE